MKHQSLHLQALQWAHHHPALWAGRPLGILSRLRTRPLARAPTLHALAHGSRPIASHIALIQVELEAQTLTSCILEGQPDQLKRHACLWLLYLSCPCRIACSSLRQYTWSLPSSAAPSRLCSPRCKLFFLEPIDSPAFLGAVRGWRLRRATLRFQAQGAPALSRAHQHQP
eukprot:385923-Amphidinium_carterae.1